MRKEISWVVWEQWNGMVKRGLPEEVILPLRT